jgi:hypothetical protein
MIPRGPAGGRGASGPKEFFMGLPWFTRVWFTAICVTTLCGTLGFISFDKFAYYGSSIFSSKLQLWRLVTCFALAGKLNFGFIMLIVMIVQYRYGGASCFGVGILDDGVYDNEDDSHHRVTIKSVCVLSALCLTFCNHSMRLVTRLNLSAPLEKTFKSTAHYAWTILLTMFAMLVVNHFIFESAALVYPLLFFCVWVYCRHPSQRNNIADVFGLFKMPVTCDLAAPHVPSPFRIQLIFRLPSPAASSYYPWFLLFLNVIMGADPVFMSFGLVLGHL